MRFELLNLCAVQKICTLFARLPIYSVISDRLELITARLVPEHGSVAVFPRWSLPYLLVMGSTTMSPLSKRSGP
ncbi:hypothetical protein ACPXBI_28725, partial [Escherichia coli]|uniref:hypothetical protein n=1 Tax=Escherichia coli TaxID=562 RepID=UPI003CE4D8E0